MLLTISYTGKDTTKLGYLLYKNPNRPQCFELSYGKAYVFYPQVSDEKTTVALLIDIDPIDLARGRTDKGNFGNLFDYVNDRPYVSSSFMSTAISKVFGTAITGRADNHQELADTELDLEARIVMLPCKGEHSKIKSVFEPLGYEVSYESFLSDENFESWGESIYVNLSIKNKIRLRDLLRHLYILIPVFDNQKHYWVGDDEVEKLLNSAQDWLSDHPEKTYITRRYLYRKRSLVSKAFDRLMSNSIDESLENKEIEKSEEKLNLNKQRLGTVVGALKSHKVKTVIDLGCGEGNLLSMLVKEKQFTKISGADVSYLALKKASEKLNLETAGDYMQNRVSLFQSSLTYKDARFSNYDAACVIEVIEHLDFSRLSAFEKVLFEFARPRVIVLTTPNKEYNANYALLYSTLRHTDHRFEWTREEFKNWANKVAEKFGYTVQFSQIGDIDENYGSPTQMGVFTLCE